MKPVPLTLLLLIAIFGAVSANAQRCGGSTRRLAVSGAGGPISYELFYVAPKNGSSGSIDNPTLGDFLREFIGDDSLAGIFWHREILAIKADIASPYLKPYRLTDFEYIYGDVWHKHHRSQLTGETTDGKIEFRTAEMDNTPFMMRLTGADLETKYVLSAFLGGCYERDEVQAIEVRKITK